jgi:multidrug resistance efflux pump
LVKAPRDGEILRINVREGEYAQPFVGDAALVLGDTKRLQVRVDIDEYNAQRVRSSASAVAYPKGDHTKTIPLSFSRFEPLVVPKKSLTGAPVERVDTRVLQVIYTFERPDWPIYVGQQLEVFIETDDLASASPPAGK